MDKAGYELTHPVYLDVPMMVSFLAYLEGGVSTSEKETSTESGARERALKGRAGLRLRLAPVLSAEGAGEGVASHTEETELELKTERHHTAASLFNLLYQYLNDDDQVLRPKTAEDLTSIRPGQLVEVAGEYLGNPLEDVLAFLATMLPYFLQQQEREREVASQAIEKVTKAKRSGNPARKAEAEAASTLMDELAAMLGKAQNSETEFGMQMMQRMADDLQDVAVHDLLMRTDEGLQVVLTVSSQHYSREINEYLRAGEFRTIGKVTRVVSDEETINLTRRTVLGAADADVARGIVQSLTGEGIRLDVPDPIVASPALQVLPMAIFL